MRESNISHNRAKRLDEIPLDRVDAIVTLCAAAGHRLPGTEQ